MIPRRAPVVVAATAAGLAGVLSFHTRPSSTLASTLATSAPPTSGRAGATAPSASPSPTARRASTASAAAGPRSATGSLEQYGYGELAVTVDVTGSRITNVTLASLRTAESYSQQLADQVVPLLRSQVLAAQSAQINGVSGATYTSEAYALSLQAALDKLHVK